VACEFSAAPLHAYFDGELDPTATAAFEHHLGSCATCVKSLAELEALRVSLEQANLYERAPEGFQQKVRSQLPARPPAGMASRGVYRWLALAAGLLLAAALGWQSARWQRPSQQQVMIAAVLDAHIRSLQPGHLVDVQSTDQHTVKPWFDGRLDFSPPVRDFAGDGFPLTGGRLDVVNGRAVAALVYGRRKHVVTVFVWPHRDEVARAANGSRQGYSWLAWERQGFDFYAVSDTAPADLVQLEQLLLKQ
jgi:anti-sigma factor RsiW